MSTTHAPLPSVWRRLCALSLTLKFRLALASVLIITVSVALAAQLVLTRVQGSVERAVMDVELGNAERMASLLANRVVGLQSALRAAATEPALLQAVAHPVQLQAHLKSQPVLASLFSTVWVALADGRVPALSHGAVVRDPGLNVADRAYFQLTLAQQRPVVSEPVLSRVSNEPVLHFTMPVISDGRTVAVLAGSMRLTSRNLLDDLTQSSQAVKDPVTTLVIDTAGRILAHPQLDRVMSDAEAEPGLAPALARWVQQGRPVEPVGDVIQADGHIVALAGVPGADWVLLRVARDDALLSGVTQARRQSLQLAAAVALTGGALVLALMGWLLRPLNRLQRRALTLGSAGLAIDEGWPEAQGEIGQLSRVLREAMRERRRSDEQAALMLCQMRSVMAAAPIGIAFSREQRLELVSSEFASLLGWDEADLTGRPVRDIYAAEVDYAALGPRVGVAFAAGLPFVDELQFRRRDGSLLWCRVQGRPVDGSNPAAGAIWLLEDVTAHRAERERLSWAASHDGLTRLANRTAFEARLQAVLQQQQQQRARGLPAALLFVDLDHFKQINDRAGHAAGDQVLRDMATLLMAHVRGADLVARLGGDEFVVLLQHCERGAALRIAEDICSGARRVGVHHGQQRLTIGASIGVAEIDGSDADVAALLARADAACYAAKHAGRNAVRVAPGATPLRLVAAGFSAAAQVPISQ